MEHKFIKIFNQYFLSFVLFFSVPTVFGQLKTVTNQKNVVSKETSASSLSASTIEINEQTTDNEKTSASTLVENNAPGEEIPGDKPDKTKKERFSAYSFQPLLIQGKKRLIQKTKDMKVESENIAESKIFFVDINFKNRIFDHENIE